MNEQEKLNDTLDYIEELIDTLKSKQFNLQEKLKELSKYEVEENSKHPIDKLFVSPYNAELHLNEGIYKMTAKKLNELNVLKDSPYFGRIDYKDIELNSDGTIYIGRFGLMNDALNEPIIIDWRSPIASLFYEDNTGRMSYEAPSGRIDVDVTLKRQFLIKHSKLINMFDTSINIDDEMLQIVLGKNAEDRLKDIVMTIQKEQNEIIRKKIGRNLIIQGVAGSGKTSIAMHKVAYLLYNYRKIYNSSNILILAPNELFLDYISDILPSLGEKNIRQMTFVKFAQWVMDKNINLVNSSFESFEKIMHKNDLKTTALSRFKGSLAYKKVLDKYCDMLATYFNFGDIQYKSVTFIDKSEILDMFFNQFSYMPMQKRLERMKLYIKDKVDSLEITILNAIKNEYNGKKILLDKSDDYYDLYLMDLKEKYDGIITFIKSDLKNFKESIGALWNMNPFELYKKLYMDDIIKKIYTENEYNIDDITERTKNYLKSDMLDNDDLAGLIYLAVKIFDLNIKDQIKHILIDEAQDLTPLEFCVIKELLRSNNITALGDISQSIFSYKSIDNWDIVKDIFGSQTDMYILTKSYRSTSEIMAFASDMLSQKQQITVVRHGSKPEIDFCETIDAAIEHINASIKIAKGKDYKSIAIICRDKNESLSLYKKLLNKNIQLILDDKTDYTGNIVILPSYLSKGIEFDSVILFNINETNYPDNDFYRKILYTMSTRALHELKIICLKNTSKIIKGIDKSLYNTNVND